MKPEKESRKLLAITRSKAKMYEYDVPDKHHIRITSDPERLFVFTLGLLGDFAARIRAAPLDQPDTSVEQATLRFSAHFFDAFNAARLNEGYKSYLDVIGAAAYYLCDLQGNAAVLAHSFDDAEPDLQCPELSSLLIWLLRGKFKAAIAQESELFGKQVTSISNLLVGYFENGRGQADIWDAINRLRAAAYENGSPRHVLFADIICAIVKKRFWNSSWYCLPRYSDIEARLWEPALKRETFLQELWPAQHLLGKSGVFRGVSAIVQMPTSAGKTRSLELIIRSAFLAERTTLAVVVAPFRALCHEIRASLLTAFEHDVINVDELTDVLQSDFAIDAIFGRKWVLVMTPEKLVYTLRNYPAIAERIGLVMYDEGHQFDSGNRGVTYELLLATLKRMLPKTTQVVLISAVISNSKAVSEWLVGPDSVIVDGIGLVQTYRTIGFASWQDPLGRINFVSPGNPDDNEFFVPRVIEATQLQTTKREKARYFPDHDDSKSVALYLGLKLVSKGAVAVFCGTKIAAASLCKIAANIYARGYGAPKPSAFSNQEEIARLHFLHSSNLGPDSVSAVAAEMGILTHHANTPHGLRLATEFAMQRNHARLVVCTSTLAQGVNLPLRYLIVTSTYQGGEKLKVRDFHNLIGRAGRSGMHTEGSILFANPEIYDEKKKEAWRWGEVKKLLEPQNSEPCVSRLLTVFDPLESEDGRLSIRMGPLMLTEDYIKDHAAPAKFADQIMQDLPNRGFSKKSLIDQIGDKLSIIRNVESFLMSQGGEGVLTAAMATDLAKDTLAYHLAGEDQRKSLIRLFEILAENIIQKIPDPKRRAIFGKTLYGVVDSLAIEQWVSKRHEKIVGAGTQEDLFEILWPLLVAHIQNHTFQSCQSMAKLREIAIGWLEGKSFAELHVILKEEDTRIGNRHATIEHVVELCENALSYEGMLIAGAVAQIMSLLREDAPETVVNLNLFQKRIKYGLDLLPALMMYELGFADRIVAQDLAAIAGDVKSKGAAIRALRLKEAQARESLEKYPAYFSDRFVALQ